ncbi:DUF1878 family protein [Thalassorhabdus alkalitolerans]|uniref:DUF1878 family protein n=1 Tax=Thalassorhabdus alkalitolerans TaxID=2282697 RepID=A0ABW0YT88_9BACI
MDEEWRERIERLEFHQKLLMELIDERHPFYRLIIKRKITEKEMSKLYSLCAVLERKLAEERKQGMVYHGELLDEFIGELNPKLNPEETIMALKKQGLYIDLVTVLQDRKRER